MKTLKQKDLLSLLAVQSESGDTDAMQEHVSSLCRSLGARVESDTVGNLYVTKGATSDGFPCVVAHLDTVHSIYTGTLLPLVIGDNVTGFDPESMAQVGIGGDDKCGIWVALKTLEATPCIKLAFFVDEEVGCVGSGACDMSFFDDVNFILQADRRGRSDFVTDISGGLSSKAFQKAVKPLITEFGYKFSPGGMTDVQELRDRGVGLSVANMSTGYYHPHSYREYINLPDLERTCQLVRALCSTLVGRFPFTPRKPSYTKWVPPVAPPQKHKSSLDQVWADWERTKYTPDPYDDLDAAIEHEESKKYLKFYTPPKNDL